MNIFESILLGLIQGITEWLPVSSSGHLALAQHFFSIEASIAFDIILHLGTLLAVVAYYRKDILSLARGILARDAKSIRLAFLILLTAIPTAIIGLSLRDFFESMFASPLSVALALAITGIFLVIASRHKSGNAKPGTRSALLIGIAQGIAVAPGISRSGSTIGTALLLGIEKEEAARFSFLAGVIPILGAAMLEGRHAIGADVELLPVIAGFLSAAVAGYLSIGLLIRLLKESRLQWFGYYCLALSALIFGATAMI
ncbi:undecaprenyl-diphosphate phosphatase [Candidatus Micrarchaeota archaeon]|nr:undecaprenyl-diphosphate phosphatase [Candidatus Micrarchaeota archaeon]